ncbi:MAG: hypothetical protein FWF25_06860, partial [Propionibacteriaceae bacterium]|nr:hypothetical protein [Propionibacteriaceae bacterium]
ICEVLSLMGLNGLFSLLLSHVREHFHTIAHSLKLQKIGASRLSPNHRLNAPIQGCTALCQQSDSGKKNGG